MRLFIYSVLHGIVSSLVLFFIPYGALFENVNYDGKNIDDYSMLAFTTFTCLVCVCARARYMCVGAGDRDDGTNIIGHGILDVDQPFLDMGIYSVLFRVRHCLLPMRTVFMDGKW
jgi:hypothetical protein